jgi:hypothetical protein
MASNNVEINAFAANKDYDNDSEDDDDDSNRTV